MYGSAPAANHPAAHQHSRTLRFGLNTYVALCCAVTREAHQLKRNLDTEAAALRARLLPSAIKTRSREGQDHERGGATHLSIVLGCGGYTKPRPPAGRLSVEGEAPGEQKHFDPAEAQQNCWMAECLAAV